MKTAIPVDARPVHAPESPHILKNRLNQPSASARVAIALFATGAALLLAGIILR